MKKIHPAILVEGAIAPLGFFYDNRFQRSTVKEWMKTLAALKEAYDKTGDHKNEIRSFEYKEFDTEEKYRRFLDEISIADSCWSETHSRYVIISERQIVLPEQEIRSFLEKNGHRIPNFEEHLHLTDLCHVGYRSDGRECVGIVCSLRLEPGTDRIFIKTSNVCDNSVSDIEPSDILSEGLYEIWKHLPIHPFVLEKNTPSQKHIKTTFDTVEEARRAMRSDYYDALRDKWEAQNTNLEEKLFSLGENSATVRWNKSREYEWRIYDIRNPHQKP